MVNLRRFAGIATSYLLVAFVILLCAIWLWVDLDDQRSNEAVTLANPSALMLLGSAVLVAWVGFDLRRSRTPTFLFSRVSELGHIRSGVVARLAGLPTALRVCSLILIAIALARPQTYRTEAREVEGIDIMIVLDLSRSMEERDLQENRLDAGQRMIRSFLQRRANDQIGLVVFAEAAMLLCPLTHDYVSFDSIVADLAIGDVPEMGTAIGDGLGLALASLRRSDADSKVIILLSDGDSNADSVMDPQVARATAVAMGVKVFAILMGKERAVSPQRARHAVNPALLKDIASTTGGVYFNAGDDQALEEAFRTVRATLEKTRYRVTGKVYGELFPRVLYLAFSLLLFELLLTFTRWRRFP